MILFFKETVIPFSVLFIHIIAYEKTYFRFQRCHIKLLGFKVIFVGIKPEVKCGTSKLLLSQ